MKCPYCGEDDTKVIDSRPADDNSSIRRRRQCERCGKRFTTYEKLETLPLIVIKKDNNREPYDRSKIEAGIVRSCHKRPVSTQQINAMLDAVTGLTAESEITDGEDLAQEAFVTCVQSIKSLRDGSKFRPWLLRTLSRAAWKYCRKAKRETPVSEFFDAGESESALSAVLRTDEQRRLYAALDTLDEKRRVTVVLYYFDDRSVREIAQATGVTEGTVKSRLFSARRHLRQALTEERKPKEAANHG